MSGKGEESYFLCSTLIDEVFVDGSLADSIDVVWQANNIAVLAKTREILKVFFFIGDVLSKCICIIFSKS